MDDKVLPRSIGENVLPPVHLTDEQENLCKRLDEWYEWYWQRGLKIKPSDMFRGAVFAIREECKSNPDCITQAANSLREILYPFLSIQVKQVSSKGIDAFKNFGSVVVNKKFYDKKVKPLWGELNDIAHHGINPKNENFDFSSFNKVEFEKLLAEFEKIMNEALTRQLDVHQMLDEVLATSSRFEEDTDGKEDTQLLKKPDPEKIRKLIGFNLDARQYFFTKADENWLDWLWRNSFLDVIKQKAEDPTRYGYRTPELSYLVKVAERKPKEVVDIMLSVPISKDNFNPEVIDRFLWICSILPAENLTKIVVKIRDEKWIPLMGLFNRWGFEYEKMFQTLNIAKDYGSILTLAEAVLAVKTKEEFKQSPRGYSSDTPFYISDLSYTKVFEYLVAVGEQYVEKALELTTKVMAEIVRLGEVAEESEVFPMREIFYLFDVDFFSLELSKDSQHADRENVKELAATIKTLTQRLIGGNCDNTELVSGVYRKYIQTLPESRSMWRLRLFVLSLCPIAFQTELKQSFSKLFEVIEAGKHYCEIESGTEYKKTLKKSFGVLDIDYQRKYVSNVFKYFGQSREDKKEEKWYRRDGWQILSSICDSLTQKEKEDCEKVFGEKCDPTFEPEPSIGKVVSGFVKPKAVISQEEFGKLSITDIAKKLKNDWKPEALREKNASDDFLNPLNAEGVGEQLRADITKRLQDYIQNASLFFERGVLDEHYTYSFFRGIQEAIRSNKTNAVGIQWDKLIEVFVTIKDSGIAKAFDYKVRERERFDAWLSSWTGVHSAMTDVLQELLNETEGKIIIDFPKYRSQLFEILDYLLAYPDPEPQDEELETAMMKTHSPGDKEEYYVSDPFTVAINTVRGRAFQSFVLFTYQDGKRFSKEEKIKISSDVKNLYEKVLKKENTRALMFMFGRYLPSFYFRDREWIHKLLPEIFSEKPEKKNLYLAAWEGYLDNNLYEEIFFDPVFQKLYERGLALSGDEDSGRKYFKEPDEGIATHLALAFIVYHKRFGFDHPLFKEFWGRDVERQAKFISFIGRIFISGDNAQANEQLKKDSESRERLIKLWEWLLQNYDDPKLFIEFGFWINLEKKIFEPVWLGKQIKATLEKTKGVLEWDYALTKSINELAKATPKETIEIARLCLLEGGVRGGKMRMPFMYDEEWFGALKALYENAETKKATYTLIDDLIREGGSTFWKLKEIIQEK